MSRVNLILIHVLMAAVVCGAGSVLCIMIGLPIHIREMVWALLICLGAAEVAMIPIFMVRNKPADNVVQGALVAMVVHLGVCAGCGVAIIQCGHPAGAFVFWLCAFYWASLAGVCRVLLRAVKSAPVPVAGSSAGPVLAVGGQVSEV